MIRRTLSLVLATALTACAGFGPTETASARGVELVVDAGSIERGAGGKPRKACLRERAVVDGLLAERWIRFHGDGALAQCFLAADARVQGRELPRGSCLWFDGDGRLETVWLAADAVFDGILCDGGWGKIAVSFHPNGRLRSCFLTEDTWIQGVPCRASALHPVELDAAGRLVRCTAAASFTRDGRAYARGDEVVLGAP